MILPTKHISAEKTLLGVGAVLLTELKSPTTVSGLWEKVKFNETVATYERFILSLVLLFLIDSIEISKGILQRSKK